MWGRWQWLHNYICLMVYVMGYNTNIPYKEECQGTG